MTIKFNLQSNQPDQKLQFTTARRKRQVPLLQGVKSVKGSKACVKPLTSFLSHPESRESWRPRWAKKLRSVRFLSGAVQLDRLRRWSSAARAGDRGVSGPRRVEAGAFNDLGRRRRFVFWRGFEREHGAAYEERRRAELDYCMTESVEHRSHISFGAHEYRKI